MLLNEYARIHEYKVQLEERKRHVSGRRETVEEAIAVLLRLEFEELTELEARINHRADPERDGAQAQVERAESDRRDGLLADRTLRRAELKTRLVGRIGSRVVVVVHPAENRFQVTETGGQFSCLL